jgi:hypothetical protein
MLEPLETPERARFARNRDGLDSTRPPEAINPPSNRRLLIMFPYIAFMVK